MGVLAVSIPRRRLVPAVTVTLPMPPSTNVLWRTAGRRLILSMPYREWKRDAGWRLCEQRPGRIEGSYALHIKACRKGTKCDLDNLCKAASDLLQAHGVISNDRLAEKITLEWGAPEGVIVTVVSTREQAEAA
jgi:crossover junction endodeoxyribonuclease RusA